MREVFQISVRVYVNRKMLERVENCLKNCKSEYGMMISEVSRALGITTSTARKYLEILVAMGKAQKKHVGKFFFYSAVE